jgi:hypothetical protein
MSLLGLDDAVVEIGQLSGPALAGEIEHRLRGDDRNGTPSSADLDSYERTISSAFASVFLPAPRRASPTAG